jgi:predicted DNA-binding transcriptional regulator AlpA
VLLFREVIEYTKLSKTEIKLRVERGTFPAPIKRSIRRLVWKASVIRAWLDKEEAASIYAPGRRDRQRRDTLH